jgi:cation diffusion facilitator CzcD-associated flavoprotein CzcO
MDDFDAIIVGGGPTGLCQLHALRRLGLSVRLFEEGEGVGGTWFWNRYPGCRFDSESYTYGFSFSEELLQEWDWKEYYSGQPENERYYNYVADKFDLRRDIQLGTRVASAGWDSETNRWHVRTENGGRATAQFLILAVGILSARYIPDFAGLESFTGTWVHTGRWPKEGLDVAGKRVGVIGTGATGVQVIPQIAKDAGSLTVFQRTPNYCVPLRNSPIDPEAQRKIKSSYPEIFRICSETRSSFPHVPDPRSAFDVSPEERRAQYERLWLEPGFRKWLANFSDIMIPGKANEDYAEFVREKIRERIDDPAVAALLVPTDYPFGSKRIPCETGYYETFNRDNVRLIDVRSAPIERITPTGVKTSAAEYELDVIVFATGYDAVTGSMTAIDIRGENGESLKDHLTNGLGNYLGIFSAGFPNLFNVQIGAFNYIRGTELLVTWVSDAIHYLREHHFTRMAVKPEVEEAWAEEVAALASGILLSMSSSYFLGVNIPGKPRRFAFWPAPAPVQRAKRAEVAANGYEGCVLQ